MFITDWGIIKVVLSVERCQLSVIKSSYHWPVSLLLGTYCWKISQVKDSLKFTTTLLENDEIDLHNN